MLFADSLNYFTLNIETLRQYHPGFLAKLTMVSNPVLCSVEDVPHAMLLGQQIALQEVFQPLAKNIRGYIVYGLGRGVQIRALLNHKQSGVPVLILDSMKDIVSFSLQSFDLRDILSHPDVTYLGTDTSVLPAQLHAYLSKRRDLLAVHWLVNPWVAQIASARHDLFFLQVFQQYQAYLERAPDLDAEALMPLYQSLAAPMQAAYAQLPLSCQSGCADCCKQGNGFDLSIQPLEWASLFRYITEIMPAGQRTQLLHAVVVYLAHNTEILTKALHFFEHTLERMQTESGNQAFYALTARVRKDPCPFLGAGDVCGVYTHRPVICRIFGNSYFAPQQPYTCDQDHGLMEKILLDERKKPYLLAARDALAALKAMHAYYPYTHFLYAWLFTHLDLAQQNWVQTPRLDYHQFQVLVEQPGRLASRLEGLKKWAQTLV